MSQTPLTDATKFYGSGCLANPQRLGDLIKDKPVSQTPLTDAYLASRCKGENKQSWVEFARGLELKLKEEQERAALWRDHAEEFAMELMELERPK